MPNILSSRFRVFSKAILVHPNKVKGLCGPHNMFRAERGAGGRPEGD